jgi:hypothetical protein
MTINHKKAYWRNRLAKEEGEEVKQILVARRSMNIDGKKYPMGSILPSRDLTPRMLSTLIDSRGAAWQAKVAGHFYPEPVDLPAPEPAKPNPKVELVDDPDVTDAWRFTEDRMTKACGGNRQLARDLLFGDPGARDLYVRAQKEQCARVARRLGRPSVTPNEAGMC